MDSPALGDLRSLLASSETVLGAWNFSVGDGYTPGDPAYLSFSVPVGYSRDQLEVWHHDASRWMKYDVADLNLDGTYANFTVTGFSGYAITTVPEPDTLAMILSAAICVAAVAWQRCRRKVAASQY